jgi:uncharacterized protein
MQLVNEFTVSQPIDDSWALLTDVERIAPCMPGAQLTEVQGDVYRGKVTVKVGPMLARFAGQAEFRELDRDAQRVVLEARGKESGGKGMASAVITAQLTEQGAETLVQVTTDLTISGRLAQFGQGALGDISTKLLGQFVDCLEHRLAGGDDGQPAVPAATPPVAGNPADNQDIAGATADHPRSSGTTRQIQSPDALPVNLLQTAGVPLLKRLAPALGFMALVAVVMVVVRRRR